MSGFWDQVVELPSEDYVRAVYPDGRVVVRPVRATAVEQREQEIATLKRSLEAIDFHSRHVGETLPGQDKWPAEKIEAELVSLANQREHVLQQLRQLGEIIDEPQRKRLRR
jgi:hypothetical protein